MHDDLISVAEAVEVIGPDAFVVAGRSERREEGALGRGAAWDWDDAVHDRPPAVRSATGPEQLLAGSIYRHCYVRPSAAGRLAPDPFAERDFQIALTRSNKGRGSWEPGWLTEASSTDRRLVASRHGVRFRVSARGLRAARAAFEKGEPCQVRVPKECRKLLPGFYLMVGDTDGREPDAASRPPTLRLYWHLTSPAAPRLLAAASRFLNGGSFPFRAKVLSSPAAYRRADAGVLYLASEDYESARGALALIYAEVRDGLRLDVPLFTRALAPGLGIAEDPGNGLSFGQHRCRLVAGALWAAHQDGRSDARSKRRAVAAAFERAGLDPDAPHLQAGSADVYRLDPVPGRRLAQRRTKSEDPPRSERRDRNDGAAEACAEDLRALLSGAVRIGHELCSQAHWDPAGERCNWVGRSNPLTVARSGQSSPRCAALGPDVYDGLSGIALFLAELFALTGEAAFRHTALAAVRCALQQLERRRGGAPPPALGFYAGVTGVVFTASRVRLRTGEDGAPRRLVELLRNTLSRRDAARSNDLISGRAGAILGLLALSRQPGWSGCRDWAIALGEEIGRSEAIAGALPVAEGHPTGEPTLTGLSHGAAGIGLGLLALHAETGREDFLACGRRAFAYEDTLFDEAEGNWRDLRPPVDPAADPSTPRFAVAWCHGAPGIALARLRASQLDPARSSDYLAQARTALDTTRKWLGRGRPREAFDATPCHGATGLIETLWSGHLLLGETGYAASALETARELLAAAGWRSGVVGGGTNPSLMLGSAGVGYHFLRLRDPAAVPPLLPVPSA